MAVKDIIKEIENLGLSDKLLLVEDIWDSIAQSNNQLPLHEWQKEELNKRYSDFKNEKLKFRPPDLTLKHCCSNDNDILQHPLVFLENYLS